jgi:predicted ArsR family transcriptional regulator
MTCLRRQVVDTLRKAAPLTTTQVAATLGYPTNTTRRTLEDLACYEVVIRQSGGPGKADLWHLSDWTQATLNAARLPEGEEEDLGAYCSDGLEK